MHGVIRDFRPTRELHTEAMLAALRCGEAEQAAQHLREADAQRWLLGENDPFTPSLRYAREAIRSGDPSGSHVLDSAIDRWPELMEALVLRQVSDWMIDGASAATPDVSNEVRQRIKNLEEGTANWDVEYQKVMEQIKQKRGLTKG